MPTRDAVPLYKTRHAALVDTLLKYDNPDISTAVHLALGVGARSDTICHTHSSWFSYDTDQNLYYQIPHSDKCRKYEDDGSVCGDCDDHNHTEYSPKTPAGCGRKILISNEWTNPVTGEREYFGLKSAIESYFAIDDPRASDDVNHGHKMLNSKGISRSTLTNWIRQVATESPIRADMREDRILESHNAVNDAERKYDIIQRRTTSDGRSIPDLFAHDLRATYCTHLMRNDVPRDKAINKTGHKNPESMNPYIDFARDEISANEEDSFY